MPASRPASGGSAWTHSAANRIPDHDRAGDQVEPAAAALVEEHPDIAEREHEPGDEESDDPHDRRAERQRAPVDVADDPDTERPHPERLAAPRPEVREVQEPDQEDDQGQDAGGRPERTLDDRVLRVG